MRLAILALSAAAAVSFSVQGVSAQGATAASGPQIKVDCYRGPWEDVIWDRPERPFIESLMAAGYDLVAAEAIGEWVCRDPAGVNDPAALVAIARRVIAENPPKRR